MKPIVKAWIAALRSGQYKQGKRVLRTPDNEYCCLGVLCEIAPEHGVKVHRVVEYERTYYGSSDLELGSYLGLPKVVQEAVGVVVSEPLVLFESRKNYYTDEGIKLHLSSGLNDKGFTFNQIADIIEAGLVEGIEA